MRLLIPKPILQSARTFFTSQDLRRGLDTFHTSPSVLVPFDILNSDLINIQKMTFLTSSTAHFSSLVFTSRLFYVAIVSYFLIAIVRSWSRLWHLPGPFPCSFSYWPMSRIRCHGSRAYSEYARLTAQYGKLVRIGPNDVITSDPELIRRMSAAKSTYERSSWYKATRLDPYHDMMGSVLDKSAHHSLRTKLSPGYVGKDIPGLEASIDSGIAELVDLIRLKYTSRSKAANIPETGEKDQVSKPSDSESVDFGRLADYYAMDARSRMSFGRPIGLLQKDTDVFGLIRTSNIAIDVLQFFTDIPALQMIFTSDLVLRLLGPSRRIRVVSERLWGKSTGFL